MHLTSTSKEALRMLKSFFHFLAIYDFYNPDYVIGLAAVYQLKKNMLRRLSSIPSLVALSKTPDETWQKRPQAYAAQCKVML